MALGLRLPKLIAEMLKIDAEYGCLHSSPPMTMRKLSGSFFATVASEWLMNSCPIAYTSRMLPKGRSELTPLAR